MGPNAVISFHNDILMATGGYKAKATFLAKLETKSKYGPLNGRDNISN